MQKLHMYLLINDVLPRDFQDDKILPKHIKINPKFYFSNNNNIGKSQKGIHILYDVGEEWKCMWILWG